MTSKDPTETDPHLYSLLFENERVRVLEYRDVPGDRTHAHTHPDSVMITLSAFERQLTKDGTTSQIHKPMHEAGWLPAQEHIGENVGSTETHVLFVELKN